MASVLDAVGEQGAEDDNDELSDEGDVGILSPGQRVYFAGNVYVVTSYDQHAGHTLRGTGSLSCVTMVCPDDVYSATGGDPLVVLPGPNAHGDAQDTAEVMTAAAVRSGGDYVGDKHGYTVFESSYLKAGLASLTALRERFCGRALRARTLLADISLDEMAGIWRTALDIEIALGLEATWTWWRLTGSIRVDFMPTSYAAGVVRPATTALTSLTPPTRRRGCSGCSPRCSRSSVARLGRAHPETRARSGGRSLRTRVAPRSRRRLATCQST